MNAACVVSSKIASTRPTFCFLSWGYNALNDNFGASLWLACNLESFSCTIFKSSQQIEPGSVEACSEPTVKSKPGKLNFFPLNRLFLIFLPGEQNPKTSRFFDRCPAAWWKDFCRPHYLSTGVLKAHTFVEWVWYYPSNMETGRRQIFDAFFKRGS